MTPERIEQERKAFEEWYYDSIGDTRLPLDKYENGCYCNPIAEDMFAVWCAAKSHSAQSEWISVEERLPKINTYVLAVTHRGLVISDRVCDYGRGKEWVSGHSDNPITHWQPLPEPPAGGAK